MLTTIFIEDLHLNVNIGTTAMERAKLQPLIVKLQLVLANNYDCDSDDLNDTVDYTKIIALLKNIAQESNFNLLERLGAQIITKIKEIYKVQQLRLQLTKPKAVPETNNIGVIIEL